MIYEDIEQRSPEWFEMRSGIATASRFGDILTSTGKPSSKQEGYINDLVAEALSREPLDYYVNDAMTRGVELEPEARRAYEAREHWSVREVAFITHESLPIGCSPDGVVVHSETGFDPLKPSDLIGGVEIKCPGHRNHIAWMRKGKAPTEYYPQIMGTIFICQVDWWDFFSYHPKITYQFGVRVNRDDKWISAFEAEVKIFNEKFQTALEEAKRHGR